MARKQSQMKRLMILLTLIALLCSHHTMRVSSDSETLPENTPFTVALLFSGDTRENITACPWIFETNTSEKIIGPNKGFMVYFSQDLSEEITAYPQIVKIVDIIYTYTYNWFINERQDDPDHRWVIRDGKNVSTFDPYYCLLWFRFDSNQTWDNQLAVDIETMFLNKWYVEQVMIIPDARVTSPSPFGSEQWYLAILLILTIITLSRRKRQ